MREELNCGGNSLIQDYKMTVTYRVYQEQQKASLKLRKDNKAGDAELEIQQGREWTAETMGVRRTGKEKIKLLKRSVNSI